MTTGNFSSAQLLKEEQTVVLEDLNNSLAIEIGEIGVQLGRERKLPIALEVRIGEWTVFKAALTGSKPENDWWINRKARVVAMKHHSTIYERVLAEENGIDWHKENKVEDETHAIHGGGLPLITKKDGFVGTLIISGLPQVEDHLLGVEIITEFLARRGESI
jgi:uncharacterized protein (UPF0303 family)